MNRVGIKEVAKMAGVSTATVSHVINNTRFVSEETKAKVLHAMKTLDYRPNLAAQSLRNQRSNTIGLIVPTLPADTSNFFFMMVAQGIQQTLKKNGYFLLHSTNSTEGIEEEIEQIKLFNSKLIDGLIIASVSDDVSYLKDLVGDKYPVVFIDRKPKGIKGDCILADGFGGAYQATRTLIEKGHRKIGLITGSLGISTSRERFEGYSKALRDHDITYSDDRVVIASTPSFDSGYESAKKLMSSQDVTALFIANNVLTMGAMKYLQENQVKIPDEVAVIGFDDYDWTRITAPPLTVIQQPSYEIGVKAAEIMLKKISKKNAKNKEYRLPTKLIMRQSC
jgi:LacI family transcriptional regulator